MQYVYLLRAGENHYKVGVAKSVKKRLAGLQTSNPTKVEIVSIKLLDDAYAIEGELHQRLKQWNVSGEWFSLEPTQVIDLLIEISKYPEPDLAINIRLRDILATQSESQRRIEQKLRVVTDLALDQLEKKRLDKEAKIVPVKEPRIIITDSDLLDQAIETAIRADKASTSMLQRRLRIGYGRAARLMEKMEEQGIVGPEDGSRPRTVNLDNVPEHIGKRMLEPEFT